MGHPNLGWRLRLTPGYDMQRLRRKQRVRKTSAKSAAQFKPRIGQTSSGPRPEDVGLEGLITRASIGRIPYAFPH